MKSHLMKLLLMVAVLASPLAAQEILPPSGSRVIPGPAGVLLSWPGSAKAKYFLQITTGQVLVAEQEVSGNRVSLQLRAGLGYQWKVNLVTPSGYQEVVPTQNFQITSDTEVAIRGAEGKSGKPGSRGGSPHGSSGEGGKDALPLTATLTPLGDYVALTVTGAPANRHYLFAPGAGPLRLASVGGTGGAGGPGVNGRDGEFYLGTNMVTLAEPGGNGGSGGPGGKGGTITVVSNGLDVGKFLQFDIRGGQGGAAGTAGTGGTSPVIPIQLQVHHPHAVQQAPHGIPGNPGQPGSDGQVVFR